MQLGRHLLRTYSGQNICVATINSLTALAKRNSLSLVDQITLILEEIGQIENNESFLVCCLTNLLDLAELMPHHWNSDQVMVCNF
jgi:predicted DNA-binding ribbon-helix-helix protein